MRRSCNKHEWTLTLQQTTERFYHSFKKLIVRTTKENKVKLFKRIYPLYKKVIVKFNKLSVITISAVYVKMHISTLLPEPRFDWFVLAKVIWQTCENYRLYFCILLSQVRPSDWTQCIMDVEVSHLFALMFNVQTAITAVVFFFVKSQIFNYTAFKTCTNKINSIWAG